MNRKILLILMALLPLVASAYNAEIDALSYSISDNYNLALADHINNNVSSYVNAQTDTIDVSRIPMIISANQLSSPYSDYGEGQNIEYLIDGDKNTFWHTDWHNESPEGMYYNGIECHYLQITGMEKMIGNCEMYLCQRRTSNDHPSKLAILGTDNLSDDGANEEWTEMAVLEIPHTGSGEENLIPFTVGKSYPYVRVLVFDCAGSYYGFRTYWHAAEIQFYTVVEGYSISISLPEGINVQDYAGMWLELTNTESDQHIHYMMTDCMTYTFSGIAPNTSWNIVLRNERGYVFGQIDNVEVKDEDASVTFSSLSKPQSVVLSVLTPEGQDVTSQTKITWTDASGNYLAQGASLSGLPIGFQATYHVVLPQNLAMRYFTPQPVDYIIKDGDNNIICLLISQSEEYDAALVAVKDGSYFIVTEVGGIKYYVSRQGELRDISELEDNAEDGLFEISQVSGGELYDVGWLLEGNTGRHFSNTTLINSEANLHPGTGVFRLDPYYNRNDWERQVFFMNEEGKLAIRSCNTAYGTSGWEDAGRAFWTYEVDEAGNPVYIADYAGLMPCYSYEPAYIWMLEQSLIMNRVLVDGINYNLDNDRMLAEVISLPDNAQYNGNIAIPPSISYNGKTYSVTRIGSRAFEGSSNLTSVTIPNSVTGIAYYAFANCNQLTDVYCLAENVPATNIYAFNNSPIASATLHVPEGSVDLYKATSPWSGFGSIVPLTSPIDEVVDEADWTLLRLVYTEMDSGEGWNRKWNFDEESHTLSGLGGITLSNGHVTNINLSSNNLTGTFPYTLLLLPNLTTLNLSNNALMGDVCQGIPEELSASALHTLNISGNQLTGNIGLLASHLPHLTHLDAARNKLHSVWPVISERVTYLNIQGQVIDEASTLHIGHLSPDTITACLPSIVTYNHQEQKLSPDVSLQCSTTDGEWSMKIDYQEEQLMVSTSSSERVYRGQAGDTLQVTSHGQTFPMRLFFDNGDANFDGDVNVLDLQTCVNRILETYNNELFNFTATNLWSDNLINAQDAVLLVNILLDAAPEGSIMENRSKRVREYDTDDAEAYLYMQDGQLMLYINKPVAALDITIDGADEMELSDALRLSNMMFSFKSQRDGLHIVAYSLSGETLPVGETLLGTVTMPNAVPSRAMLATEDAQSIRVSISNSAPTGLGHIKNGTSESELPAYDLQGRRVGKGWKGIYIQRGRKEIKLGNGLK